MRHKNSIMNPFKGFFNTFYLIVVFTLLSVNVTGQSVSITSTATQICKGNSITFNSNVNASGYMLNYSWQVSTNNGSSFNSISGQNGSSYTTASLTNNSIIRLSINYENDNPPYDMGTMYSNTIQITVNETQADINTVNIANAGSLKFNGTNQSLDLSNPMTYGTGAFTIECWFRLNAVPAQRAPILGSMTNMGVSVYIPNTMNQIRIDAYGNSFEAFSFPAIYKDIWYHLAIVRNSSNTETVFLNGVRSSSGTITDTKNYSSSSMIGSWLGTLFGGYLTDLRIVTGTALYDPTQSTLTVPSSPLTNVANTKLLLNATNGSSYLTDNSGTQTSITNNNGVVWSGGNPYPININPSSNATISNATVGGVWSSSNSAILQVNSSGVLTPVATGNATISYTVTSLSPFTCVSLDSNQFLVSYTSPPSASSQTFCPGATVNSLVGTGTDLKWYTTSSGGSALISSTILNTGTYYVSQTISGIESARTSVSITANTFTWTGGTGNWNLGSNWSCSSVPDGSNNIEISSGKPILDIDFTLQSSKSLIISGTGSMEVAAGKVFTIAGNANFGSKLVTLKSDNTGTAAIGQVTGSLSNANNLTVERYIPGGSNRRRSRLLASPVVGGTALQWRNNGDNASGLGIQITGTGGAGNNFDASSNNSNPASAWSYTNAAAISSGTNGADWIGFTTGTMSLTNGTGYRVLVRGDRLNDLSSSSSTTTNTTISVTGSYPTSPVTISTTRNAGFSNGWNLIGNPFPSAISWNAISKGSDIGGSYYIFDPVSNTYVSWNGTIGSATDIIASGQGFFVLRTTGTSDINGDLTISESCKSASQGGTFFGKKSVSDILKITMKYDSSNFDDHYIHFREDATNGPDNFDAQKLSNPYINLCSMDELGNRYNINSLGTSAENERIVPLSIANSNEATYTFEFKNIETFTNTEIYLTDNFMNTTQRISNAFNYGFSITSDIKSKQDGRFSLLFKKSANGINHLNASNEHTISLYPNPAKDKIHLSVNNNTGGLFFYAIFNQIGEIVSKGEVDFNQQKNNTLEVDQLSSGVYFIQLSNSGIQETIKFVK